MELTVSKEISGKIKWTKFSGLKLKLSKKDVRKLLKKIHNAEHPESAEIVDIRTIVKEIAQENLDEELGPEEIVQEMKNSFPLFGLPIAFKKFQSKEPLSTWEESCIIKFANRFVTVSTNEAFIGSQTELPKTARNVKELVEMCNTHKCTKSCFKYADGVCR